jgi:hypothetical protein
MHVADFNKRRMPSINEESLSRRLVRLDTRIKNQFDLISSRTGWLLTSQAFLLAAFGAVLNKSTDVSTPPAFELIRNVSFFSMPIVGMLLCALVHVSVFAAYDAIAELKDHRSKLLSFAYETFKYENTEPSAYITKRGDLPPKVFPSIMFGIWAVMLILVIVALTMPPVKQCY